MLIYMDTGNWHKILDIPIAGVEVLSGSLYTTPEYIVTNAVDIVRSDVTFKGGLTLLMKTAHLAEAFGMRSRFIVSAEWN